MPGGMTEGQWAVHHAEHEVTITRIEPGDYGCCEICEAREKRIEHHISYEPEKTILICKSCHNKIHTNDDFRPDLTPENVPEERQWDSSR